MENISWRKQTSELQNTASYFGLQTPSFDSRNRSRPLLSKHSNCSIGIVIRSCKKHKIIPYGRSRRERLSSHSWFSQFTFHSLDWINRMKFLWFLFSPYITLPPTRHITSVYISSNVWFTNRSHIWHVPTVTQYVFLTALLLRAQMKYLMNWDFKL